MPTIREIQNVLGMSEEEIRASVVDVLGLPLGLNLEDHVSDDSAERIYANIPDGFQSILLVKLGIAVRDIQERIASMEQLVMAMSRTDA